MKISYDYYKTFYFVAKCGSLTLAARQLGNNQPNVSRIIQSLEAQWGSALFVRSSNGMQLTPAGEKLYEYIRPAVEKIRFAESELKAENALHQGMVSVAVTEIGLRLLLLPVLNQFHRKYKNIRIRLFSNSSAGCVDAVRTGLADFALVITPIELSDRFTVEKVKVFQEVAIGGRDFDFLAAREHSLNELAAYPLISLGEKTGTRNFYMQFFARHGISFSPDIEAASYDHIVPLVKQNLGIGFVPEDFLRNQENLIVQLPLKERIPQREICCIRNCNDTLTAAAAKLLAMIKE